MKRRDFIAASAAIPLASGAMAETETPIRKLFQEWREVSTRAKSMSWDLSEEECERLTDQSIELEQQIKAEPSQTTQDILMKLIALSDFGMWVLPVGEKNPELWAEAEAFI